MTWNWQKTVIALCLFGLLIVRDHLYGLEASPEASAIVKITFVQAIVSLLFLLALIS